MQPWDSLCEEFAESSHVPKKRLWPEQDCTLSWLRGECSAMKKLHKVKNSFGQAILYEFITKCVLHGYLLSLTLKSIYAN